MQDVIALDGPSGTGKSTVARELARRLGFRYLDTGAMYRAVTWAVLEAGVDPEDRAAVGRIADRTVLDLSTDPDRPGIVVDGVKADEAIRTAAVTTAVSPVSATPHVREVLVAAQREIVAAGHVVVEGRDIGTVVAPAAPLKVFLTASTDARARRRSRQDGSSDHASTAEELDRRDAYDTSRQHSPLRAAADAVHLDTTSLSIDEVIHRLVDLAQDRGVVPRAAGVDR